MYAKPIRSSARKAIASTPRATRRDFLKGAATALVVGAVLSGRGRPAVAAAPGDAAAPNAFIRIAPDNTVTVLVKHLDKGQGITTGLATIVAEELDADWAQMRTAFAPSDPALYNNLAFGPIQGTGGSTSTANSWMQLRKAGGAARSMLVSAAAAEWSVPASEIRVEKGVLSHASGKSATFGQLAAKAATMPVPGEPALKDPKDFRLIGTRVPRLDSHDKSTGKTIYALDVRRPGMKTAVLVHPPRFGGTVASVDDGEARKTPGVVDVVVIPQGVAVVANNTWSALKGREALKVVWNDDNAEKRSTADLVSAYRSLAATQGAVATKTGDVSAALGTAAKVIEAEFVFPYLAHAPMEPLNAVIEPKPDGTFDVWAGAQLQTVEQATVAGVLGVTPDKVTLNTVWAGGSFGRRATPNADYFGEAAAIVKATGARYPVHLVYTREDDIKGGRYRPMFLHKVTAALDKDGRPVAWQHRLVGQSFILGSPFEGLVRNGIDATAVEGAADLPYAIDNLQVEWHATKSPVTTLWWRSVGHTHTAQAVEVMIDELAHAAGQDPVAYRLQLLANHPRHVAVLRLAAEKVGWTTGKLGVGRGRGVAVHESFDTVVAMITDVRVAPDGQVKVERVVCAVDCGIAINPDIVRAQMEGGVGYGLGAALRNQITLTAGVVDQSNFDTYEPLRMSDMPAVDVHIVPSSEPPTGVGEPGVPPVAPALSNAIFAATGKRLRSLPLDFGQLRGA
jgi:isoquinoline 1-oxidoreductase beta subunit